MALSQQRMLDILNSIDYSNNKIPLNRINIHLDEFRNRIYNLLNIRHIYYFHFHSHPNNLSSIDFNNKLMEHYRINNSFLRIHYMFYNLHHMVNISTLKYYCSIHLDTIRNIYYQISIYNT